MRRFSHDEVIEEWGSYWKPALVQAIQIEVPFEVETLEGVMTAKAGDWLMKGPAGELYSCDAETFANTYVNQEKMKTLSMSLTKLSTNLEDIGLIVSRTRQNELRTQFKIILAVVLLVVLLNFWAYSIGWVSHSLFTVVNDLAYEMILFSAGFCYAVQALPFLRNNS